MDDGVALPGVALAGHSDTPMDLDLVDELLFGGCWLETTDGSDFFLNNSPSTSAALIDSPYPWPMLESGNSESIPSPSQKSTLEDKESSDLPQHSTIFDSQVEALVNRSSSYGISPVASPYQFANPFHDGSEPNKIFWIRPQAAPSPVSSVTKRLLTALNYIKDSARNKDVLIQIWVPVNRGGAQVLTAINQPFTLDSRCSRLVSYRNISEAYHFAAEEQSEVCLGLPGRVYVGKVPEWTPDVRFFRADEYPRVVHAQEHDVRGTLALPVFEQGSQNCLGVIEVVMTTQRVSYRPELENVCRALQAVDLRSSEISSAPNSKEFNCSYQAVLPEILEVLRSACGSHGLPLAQTWVPCIQHGKEGCRHSDKNLARCVSTIDDACFVSDPKIQGFHKACSEHHLLKGQGVAGKAFLVNQPCFCRDITNDGQTEYPLSHHARVFGLCAAVAIRLRSIYTGYVDFVLEFFLPLDCRDPEEQRKMLSSLSLIIQQVSRSLRVVTEEELEQEFMVFDNSMVMVSDGSPRRDKTIKPEGVTLSSSSSQGGSAGALTMKQSGGVVAWLKDDCSRELLNQMAPDAKQDDKMESSCFRGNACGDGGSDHGVLGGNGAGVSSSAKLGERKRTKSEKVITLEVLRQHFAGSLKDAARSIGVCPTTLKRICRQHGIKRWPSRKIKKVGHSLQKLQLVIDSVHGTSGSFQFDSFYSTYPDLASPKVSKSGPFSPPKSHVHPPQSSSHEPGGGEYLSPCSAASKSPSSSCSQSSSSSSGTRNKTVTWNINSGGSEEPSGGKSSDDSTLKGAGSEAKLTPPDQEPTKLISSSQSQKALIIIHDSMEMQPTLPKHGGQQVQVGDVWRVKVAYGEEKIRFRLAEGWGFEKLAQEVVKRFNLGDISGFHLKYLDDDAEWVLLTCDADLEECIDICRTAQQQTIKLSLQISNNHSKSSVGSLRLEHPTQ